MSAYCFRIKCNCKYRDEEEGCMFYYMGSGEEEDMPCYADEDEEEKVMKFITLNRPDAYASIPIGDGNIERRLIKQKPVTINPEYIASMVERFDNNKEFESTELYLSNGVWYNVTSRIEEIIKMIEEA